MTGPVRASIVRALRLPLRFLANFPPEGQAQPGCLVGVSLNRVQTIGWQIDGRIPGGNEFTILKQQSAGMAQGIINNQMLWVPVRCNVPAFSQHHWHLRVGEVSWLREMLSELINQGTEALIQQAFGWFRKGSQPLVCRHFGPFGITGNQPH